MNRLCASVFAIGSLLLAGCSRVGEQEVHAAPGYPRTYRGPLGLELTLNAPPRRIVPGNAAALDFLLALAAQDRIAAVPTTAAAYSAAYAALESPEFQQFRLYSAERILELDPDLIVTHAWQKPEATQILKRAGIPVLLVPTLKSFDDVLHVLRFMGDVMGSGERAEGLCNELTRRREALKSRVRAGQGSLRLLSYSDHGTGGFVAGKGTSGDLLIDLVGHRNAAEKLHNDRPIDIEQLITMAPDVIVVSGSEDDPERSPTRDYLMSDRRFKALRAVRERRFVVLPPNLAVTTSHHLLDAAELLAARLEALPR